MKRCNHWQNAVEEAEKLTQDRAVIQKYCTYCTECAVCHITAPSVCYFHITARPVVCYSILNSGSGCKAIHRFILVPSLLNNNTINVGMRGITHFRMLTVTPFYKYPSFFIFHLWLFLIFLHVWSHDLTPRAVI